MTNFLAVFGYILVLTGLAFNIGACVGMARLSSHHWRFQTAIKGATAGTVLILIGVFLIKGLNPVGIKALVLSLLMLIIIPAAAHAVARTAHVVEAPAEPAADGTASQEEK